MQQDPVRAPTHMILDDPVSGAIIEHLHAAHEEQTMPTYRDLYRSLRPVSKPEVDISVEEMRKCGQIGFHPRPRKPGAAGRNPTPYIFLTQRWRVTGEPLFLVYHSTSIPWDHSGELEYEQKVAPTETHVPAHPSQPKATFSPADARQLQAAFDASQQEPKEKPEPAPDREYTQEQGYADLRELVSEYLAQHKHGPSQSELLELMAKRGWEDQQAKRLYQDLIALQPEAYMSGGLRRLAPDHPQNPTDQARIYLRTDAQAEDRDTAEYHAAQARESKKRAQAQATGH